MHKTTHLSDLLARDFALSSLLRSSLYWRREPPLVTSAAMTLAAVLAASYGSFYCEAARVSYDAWSLAIPSAAPRCCWRFEKLGSLVLLSPYCWPFWLA